jgi:hypothetical protein
MMTLRIKLCRKGVGCCVNREVDGHNDFGDHAAISLAGLGAPKGTPVMNFASLWCPMPNGAGDALHS